MAVDRVVGDVIGDSVCCPFSRSSSFFLAMWFFMIFLYCYLFLHLFLSFLCYVLFYHLLLLSLSSFLFFFISLCPIFIAISPVPFFIFVFFLSYLRSSFSLMLLCFLFLLSLSLPFFSSFSSPSFPVPPLLFFPFSFSPIYSTSLSPLLLSLFALYRFYQIFLSSLFLLCRKQDGGVLNPSCVPLIISLSCPYLYFCLSIIPSLSLTSCLPFLLFFFIFALLSIFLVLISRSVFPHLSVCFLVCSFLSLVFLPLRYCF